MRIALHHDLPAGGALRFARDSVASTNRVGSHSLPAGSTPALSPAAWSLSAWRISSISNAARIVSISTVARMVPTGIPSASCAATKTSFHSFASRWLSILGR